MKRFFCLFSVLVLFPSFCLAALPDISGLSYSELLLLSKKVRAAMLNSKEWQKVVVPPGVWEIGREIPAGHWTIKPDSGLGPDLVIYASRTKDQGHDVDVTFGECIMEVICSTDSPYNDGSYKNETDFYLEDGHFLRLDCRMIFTPYAGKPKITFY